MKKSLGSEASSSKSINSSVEYALAAAAHPNTTMAHTLENIFTDSCPQPCFMNNQLVLTWCGELASLAGLIIHVYVSMQSHAVWFRFFTDG